MAFDNPAPSPEPQEDELSPFGIVMAVLFLGLLVFFFTPIIVGAFSGCLEAWKDMLS